MPERQHISLNLQVRGLNQSATLEIKRRVRRLRAEGRTIVDLGLGQSPFPVPEHVVQSLRDHAPEKDYLPVEGLPELRQAIAQHRERTQGVPTDADQVLVGPGSKELLFLLQLCFYGDLVVSDPCWVSYTPQGQIVGHKVHSIETDLEGGWKVTAEDVRTLFEAQRDRYRPRLFVLNYPGNPTGVSYSPEELEAIAAVAREYEVLILSDEIYSGLAFDGNHCSIARFYPEGTIVLNGISKWAGAGGWRLGAFVFPRELMWLQEAMAAVASETYTSVCTPVQHAAVTAFGNSEMEDYLSHARRVMESIVLRCHGILADAGVQVVRPDGAFYMFPDFGGFVRRFVRRRIRTSKDLCDRVLEEVGIAMLPGSSFMRDAEEFTARMSLVDFDGPAALRKSMDLGLDAPLPDDFADQVADDLVQAMHRLVRWLQPRH